MYFECPCSFRKELEQESQIIRHIDSCQEFNSDSPLCNMYKRGNVEEIPIEQLVTFLCDLKLQVERIENVLNRSITKQLCFIGGYRKQIIPIIEDLNFDHSSKQNSSSQIKQNNVAVKQNSIVLRFRSKNKSNVQQPFKIDLGDLNQNNNKTSSSLFSPHHFEDDKSSNNLTTREPNSIIQEQSKINSFQQQDQKLACEACRKPFYFNQDFGKLWFLENCGHVMCKFCIHRLAREDYIENGGKIMCKEIGCNAYMRQFELKEVLGIDMFNDLDKRLALKKQNIVECIKCQFQFSFDKDTSQELDKGQQGKNISGEALIKDNNRFICEQCQTEQCRECNAVPYHIGMTCQLYKNMQYKNKCILCDLPCEGKVCNKEYCQRRIQRLCQNTLDCSHSCYGVQGEECVCLLCSNQEPNDYCNICFTEPLKFGPCVKTECGHIFHEECILKKLDAKWVQPRISFQYCTCPICKKWLNVKHQKIQLKLNEALQLKSQIQELCLERLDIEGMKQAQELRDPKSYYYQNPQEFGMDKFCFYECFKCNNPYFGGIKNSQAGAENYGRIQFNKEDLICSGCCPISFEAKCNKHGYKYVEFKCRFCCSVAAWFCLGKIHYCETCHSGSNPNINKPCPGPEKCPLGIDHMPTGQENALGCALCRTK